MQAGPKPVPTFLPDSPQGIKSKNVPWLNVPQSPVFSFVLVQRFSLLALAGAIEPLRHANHALGQDLYRWPVYTEDGRPIQSSSGVEIRPEGPIADVSPDSNIILVGGADILAVTSMPLRRWLRKMAVRVQMIGGLCTASRILADAGLLDGYRATIHWEMAAGFREAFPKVEVMETLFEIDRNRLTCAGEAASADLMLSILAASHGQEVAGKAAAQILHGRVRAPVESQASAAIRMGTRNRHLLKVIALMENSLDDFLSIEHIVKTAGCSRRQLERIFKENVGASPMRYYRNLRLDRARQLLSETEMSSLEVAIACGFGDTSSFSEAFTRRFGVTPLTSRKIAGTSHRARQE